MKPRKQLGNLNRVGAAVTRLRTQAHMKQKTLMAMMQTRGIDIGPSSLSDLEGQNRHARDDELWAIADIFHVSIDVLFQNGDG